MKYKLYKLRAKDGHRVEHPRCLGDVTLDIDKGGMAMAFDGRQLLAELQVQRVEAHAAGIYLCGLEPYRENDWRYQEWYLAYP